MDAIGESVGSEEHLEIDGNITATAEDNDGYNNVNLKTYEDESDVNEESDDSRECMNYIASSSEIEDDNEAWTAPNESGDEIVYEDPSQNDEATMQDIPLSEFRSPILESAMSPILRI